MNPAGICGAVWLTDDLPPVSSEGQQPIQSTPDLVKQMASEPGKSHALPQYCSLPPPSIHALKLEGQCDSLKSEEAGSMPQSEMCLLCMPKRPSSSPRTHVKTLLVLLLVLVVVHTSYPSTGDRNRRFVKSNWQTLDQ